MSFLIKLWFFQACWNIQFFNSSGFLVHFCFCEMIVTYVQVCSSNINYDWTSLSMMKTSTLLNKLLCWRLQHRISFKDEKDFDWWSEVVTLENWYIFQNQSILQSLSWLDMTWSKLKSQFIWLLTSCFWCYLTFKLAILNIKPKICFSW